MNTLLANFPHSTEFREDSFVASWHEKALFDQQQYWMLEKEIVDLCTESKTTSISRDIAWPLTRIFSYIMMSIQAHYDVNDSFRIGNLNDEQMRNFRDRFQQLVEGFFSGTLNRCSDFSNTNPMFNSKYE